MEPQTKIIQYLEEAHATEIALTNVLTEQVAMTPRGSYRKELERHLGETQDHARRVRGRLDELGATKNPVAAAGAIVTALVGQTVALAKSPLDLLRGTSGSEKILKNAKDTAATEALEIATYEAIERLARGLGDTKTANLAASIRKDEERMLAAVRKEIPALTDDVVKADVEGEHVFEATKTGAADTARRATRAGARKAGAKQPWPGYDKHSAEEIRKRLSNADTGRVKEVRRYERAHKNRSTVLEATETAAAAS
jgi:ferritin-like metal-binding protein YciE